MDWKQESLLYNCLRCFKPLFQLLCGEHSGHIRSRETISRTRLASLLAQQVKNLPVIQETQQIRVRSLGREDPLEKGMATRSSTLAWRIPWMEEPGGLQSMGVTELDMTEWLTLSLIQAACHRALARLGSIRDGEKVHVSERYFRSRPTIYATDLDLSGQLYFQGF